MKISLPLLLLLVGCSQVTPNAAASSLTYGVTDAALLAKVNTIGLALFANDGGQNSCEVLVDDDVASWLERTPLVQKKLEQSGDDLLGVLNRIEDLGTSAVLLFASTKTIPAGQSLDGNAFTALADSIIAVGCENVTVEAGKRVRLNIGLYPAGRR